MSGGQGAGAHHAPSARSDAGFSIVEVIAAMVIFALVSAGALTMVLRATTSVRGNQDRVIAAALAASELDRLAALGSENIPLGRTETTVQIPAGDFTITSDATWAAIGAPINPCSVGDGVSPARSYLRLQVSVLGGDLTVPQTTDGLVYPSDAEPLFGVGTLTVLVTNSAGQPVSGTGVAGSAQAGPSFGLVTPSDGCLYIPDLVAGSWAVRVTKQGYRAEVPGQEIGNAQIAALRNTALTFVIDRPGRIDVTVASGEFTLPESLTFSYGRSDTSTVFLADGSVFPATLEDMWPSAYTLTLGDCPATVPGSSVTVAVPAGGTASATLPAGLVEFVAPEGSAITATRLDVPEGVSCTVAFELGAVGADQVLRAALPYGLWSVGISPSLALVDRTEARMFLGPAGSPCSVTWLRTAPPGEDLGEDEEPPPPEDDLPELSSPCPVAAPQAVSP